MKSDFKKSSNRSQPKTGEWTVFWRRTEIPERAGPSRVVLRVTDPIGRRRDVALAPNCLVRPQLAVNEIVDRTGCTSQAKQLRACIELIAESPPRRRVVVTHKSGRSGNLFVTPAKTLVLSGSSKPTRKFDSLRAQANPALAVIGQSSGTLDGWKRRVAGTLGASSAGIVAIAAALAPSLLEVSGLSEAFILILAGRSSTGKSLVQTAAMSVQGAARRDSMVPPNLSERALEEIGAGVHQLLFVLDDLSNLSQVSDVRKVARWLTYHFCAGGGKAVSTTMSSTLPFERFRSIGLISYEFTSAEIAAQAGTKRLPGETVRMLDLHPHAQLGVFDRLPRARSPAKTAKALERAMAVHYGVALPAFLHWLAAQDEKALGQDLRRHMREFKRAMGPLDAIHARAADKFGFLFGVLILARRAGVIPWSRKRCLSAVRRSCRQAVPLVERPTTGAELVETLRNVLRTPGSVCSARKVQKADLASDSLMGVECEFDGRPVLGLRRATLKKHFPAASDRERLFAELRATGLMSDSPDAHRWLTRLGREPAVIKARLIRCERRLAA